MGDRDAVSRGSGRSGGNGARLVLPQMRLDDLLAELQSRLNAVLATRDRVHALLEAVVSIGGDLDQETVLRRITEAATTLVDARYGALGVIGEDGGLEQFITVGVTEEQIHEIGQWPHGHGLLGLLIKDPQALRLPDIAKHAESYGFPDNHPPMRGFLGVPIRVRNEVFGNLYLTEKVGTGEFDDDDEIVLTALATAAGVAIENTRLYQDTRRRERWLEASGDISTALLSGMDPDQVLAMVARKAREISGARLSAVGMPEDDELAIVAADGDHADVIGGLRVPFAGSASERVARSGTAMLLPDAHDDPAIAGALGALRVGPVMLVPLGTAGSVRGVLGVASGAGGPEFGAATQRMVEAFAAQAAVAIEFAERRRDTERLIVLEDRDRIAKDLHDTVIQRLFATAMTLMSAAKTVRDPDAADRVRRAVDDLDETIRQIRSSIFALQAPATNDTLRSRVMNIVEAASSGLGFSPGVRVDGLLDTRVPHQVGENLLAVLGEALSNITRHARATEVDIALEVTDTEVRLVVIDNGVGIPEGGRRSGLRNMAERARSLGGTFAAGTGRQRPDPAPDPASDGASGGASDGASDEVPGPGTTIEWTASLGG
jgi:signal transduction histidine kinase